jgi:hypothetical protein
LIKMENLDLSHFLTTKSQANDFSARCTAISDKVYETDFNLEDELQKEFGFNKSQKFISLLRDNNVAVGTSADLKNFFTKITQTVNSLPVTTLELAIEPDNEILKSISDWFLLNLKKQVLVEVEIKPDLIAGAAVNFKGKRHDFSIRPIFLKTTEEMRRAENNITAMSGQKVNGGNGQQNALPELPSAAVAPIPPRSQYSVHEIPAVQPEKTTEQSEFSASNP